MANPMEVIERKLAQQQTELDRAVCEMQSLMLLLIAIGFGCRSFLFHRLSKRQARGGWLIAC